MCKRQDLKNKKYIKDLKPGDFFRMFSPYFSPEEDEVISICDWSIDPNRVIIKTKRYKLGLLHKKNMEIKICAKNKD